MTAAEYIDYTSRAAAITVVACILCWMIGYFVSDREED